MDDDGGQHHRGKLEVSSPVATVFGIGFAFVLLAILHLIYVGWCKNTGDNNNGATSNNGTRTHDQRPREPLPTSSSVNSSGGLAVQLVVTVRYGKERKEDECVVCLSQFVQGEEVRVFFFLVDEEVRVLVQCGHVFHVSCIETWLRSHPTCPICRVNTVAGGR